MVNTAIPLASPFGSVCHHLFHFLVAISHGVASQCPDKPIYLLKTFGSYIPIIAESAMNTGELPYFLANIKVRSIFLTKSASIIFGQNPVFSIGGPRFLVDYFQASKWDADPNWLWFLKGLLAQPPARYVTCYFSSVHAYLGWWNYLNPCIRLIGFSLGRFVLDHFWTII